jgi:hypothetical protein
MRVLRHWAPMVLMMLLMLTLGARVLSLDPQPSLATQGEPQAAPLQQYPATQQPDPSQASPTTDASYPSQPTTDPAQPTTDPGVPTLDPGVPTTDPAVPTLDPGVPTDPVTDQFPTDEQFTPTTAPIEPTFTPEPTATATPEGATVSCQSGSVVELTGGEGDLIPDTPLLVYFRDTSAEPTPIGAFTSFDSGGEQPTDAPASDAPPGSSGTGVTRIVGSGQVRYDGYFRLAVALGRLKAGSYPIEVRERDSQRRVGSFVCNATGALPTPLIITPGRTPAPERGNELVCIAGDQLQVTGLAQPRTPLLLSFGGQQVTGSNVRDDGTYNLPVVFAEQRGGRYLVEVTERDSRVLLTRFTCQVPTLPTITPRNDAP